MLRKTLLTVFTRTMLGASIVAPIAVHAQLPLRVALLLSPAALLPVSLAVVLLVSLIPAVLLVLGRWPSSFSCRRRRASWRSWWSG